MVIRMSEDYRQVAVNVDKGLAHKTDGRDITVLRFGIKHVS